MAFSGTIAQQFSTGLGAVSVNIWRTLEPGGISIPYQLTSAQSGFHGDPD